MVSLANFKYLNYLIGLVITVIVEFIMIFFITKRSKRVTPVITYYIVYDFMVYWINCANFCY